MQEMPELGGDEVDLYGRMALHLGAAFRCRARLRTGAAAAGTVDRTAGAEAILDPAGKVVHAEGLAKTREAQDTLKEARRRFDHARRGSADPLAAAHAHSPVVDARWTLLVASESDGADLVVARENQAAVAGLKALSERERQVVVLLALGRSSKEIAYALGISDSTTRVLLSRARARLGAKTRDELIGIVTRQALPGL
jgi:DNA-binding CsgD family transcriptional regulator